MNFNAKRIRKAMGKTFERAFDAVREARECKKYGDTVGFRAAMETVADCRKLNSDRRKALAVGHQI